MIRWLKRLFGVPVIETMPDPLAQYRAQFSIQDAAPPPPVADEPLPNPGERQVPLPTPVPSVAAPEPQRAAPRNAGARTATAGKPRAPRRHK